LELQVYLLKGIKILIMLHQTDQTWYH